MRRGEVWWADLPPPVGECPVLLVSRDEAYAVRAFVMVAPVTTRVRKIRAEVPLGKKNGLPRASVANVDSLATVPTSALRRRMGGLAGAGIRTLDEALQFSLGLER